MAGKSGHKRADGELIAALAAGYSQAEAARRCGVSARTVARRVSDPGFRSAVLRERQKLVDSATGVLSTGARRAARKLITLVGDNDPKIALPAARALLELCSRYRDSLDLEERLEAIEQELKRNGNR